MQAREHFTVFGYKKVSLTVDSRWFRGSAKIVTYELEELLETKLRALYQRGLYRVGRHIVFTKSSEPLSTGGSYGQR